MWWNFEHTSKAESLQQWKGRVVSVHTTKIYEGVEVWLRLLLIKALYGSEWPGSRPGHFTTDESAADKHCTGDWLHPRAGPDALEKRKYKNLSPVLEIYIRYLGYPARSLICIPTTLSRSSTERICFIISQILLKLLALSVEFDTTAKSKSTKVEWCGQQIL